MIVPGVLKNKLVVTVDSNLIILSCFLLLLKPFINVDLLQPRRFGSDFISIMANSIKVIVISLFHFITLSLFLHHQHEIIDDNIMVGFAGSENDLLSSQNILISVGFFYLICIGTIIISITPIHLSITTLSVILSIIIAIIYNIIHNSPYITNKNLSISIALVPIHVFISGLITFKQWSMYLNLSVLHKLLVYAQPEKRITYKHRTAILSISYNIIFNTFCFGIYGEHCSVDKIGKTFWFIFLFSTFYTFYKLPVIKYDLYYEYIQIKSIFVYFNLWVLCEVSWVTVLQYQLDEWYKQLFRIVNVCAFFGTMTIIPFLVQTKKTHCL